MTEVEYRRQLAPLLVALDRVYTTGRPHRTGSRAEQHLLREGGALGRDARTYLLGDEVRRAYANACELAAIDLETDDTLLDDWDAGATVLATALALLCELHGPRNLAGALREIASYMTGDREGDSEEVLNVLDDYRHGYRSSE